MVASDAVAVARGWSLGVLLVVADKTRPDALRFYAALGFVASHKRLSFAVAGQLSAPSAVLTLA